MITRAKSSSLFVPNAPFLYPLKTSECFQGVEKRCTENEWVNPILQKFYEMICEAIVFKTVCGIFWIFYRSCFISNFIVKSKFRNRKITKSEDISKSIFYKNFPYIVLKILYAQISWKHFSPKKSFFKDLEPLSQMQNQ